MSDEITSLAPAALGAITEANTNAAIRAAKSVSRDMARCCDQLLAYVSRPEVARQCIYGVPRGGKIIQGPSVRLAELAHHLFGGIEVRVRTIAADRKAVTCEATAFDMVTLNRVVIEATRKVAKPTEDMMNLAIAACQSVAYRNATLRIIPPLILEPVVAAAMDALTAKNSARSHADKFREAAAAWSPLGISGPELPKLVGRAKPEEIDDRDFAELISMYNAVREGSVSVDQLRRENGL